MAVILDDEICAMKYAEHQSALSTFMLTAALGRETMTIDYFVWLLHSQGHYRRRRAAWVKTGAKGTAILTQ